MAIHYVYILLSDKGYSYIGQTADLEDRFNRHITNRSKSTKNKGNWKIEVYVKVKSRSEAVRLETKLKRMKNVEKAIVYLRKFDLEHPD